MSGYHRAIKNRDLDGLLQAIEADPEGMGVPDKYGNLPLHRACELQFVEGVKYLAMEGKQFVDVPTCYGGTPIILAVENVEMMQILVQSGGQSFDIPDGSGNTPWR